MIATSLTLLLVLIGISIPVGAALGLLGLLLDNLYSFLPLARALGEITWSTSNDFLLVAIPMFVMLGEILLRSGIAERMYNAMSMWLSWLPGGLMRANIGASTIFSAPSGASVATAATGGTSALRQLARRGYNEPLFLGSLAAGGTLGILLPPSINLIISGVLTNSSVPRLYLAGVLPGLGMALLFMLFIAVACTIKPEWGGERISGSWRDRLIGLLHVVPPMLIFLLVVGSIYAGIATPTEAAALGVVGALILAASMRRLTLTMIREVLEGTMKTTAMIMLIVIGAAFLNFIMSATGLTNTLNSWLIGLGLSPYMMLLMLVVFYLIVGCFMETLSLMVTTIPVIAPVMIAMGFDPVWLGIVIIILIAVALITPPVGLNLFVVHSLRTSGSMNALMIGSLPFVVMLLLMVGLLALFPQLALWLPQFFN